MSGAAVLQENADLLRPGGTGVATYALNLARATTFPVEALVDTPRRLDRRDPLLAEVGLFDDPEGVSRAERWHETVIGAPLRYITGSPLGLRALPVERSGTILPAQGLAADPTQGYAQLHAAHRLRAHAASHFDRWGRFVQIRLASRPAMLHATHPVALEVKGVANIQTIHDLVPLRLPWATLDQKRRHLRLVRRLCGRADHIVTVSEHSRRDIIALTGIEEGRISNLSQGVWLPRSALDMDERQVSTFVENRFQLPYRGYFLFIGAIEPKKNLARLIDAYAASGSRSPLVVAGGPGWSAADARARLGAEEFVSLEVTRGRIRQRRMVRRLDFLSRPQLLTLLRGARATVMPSLAEGFGLPVLESMQLGTPVLTSRAGALPEVAGDAALFVDPFDVEDMRRALVALDADADLRGDLARRGLAQAARFSMAAYSARVDALYRRFST